LEFDGCHCLLGRNDAIVKERKTEWKQTKTAERLVKIAPLSASA
jgi:hypothetical protein